MNKKFYQKCQIQRQKTRKKSEFHRNETPKTLFLPFFKNPLEKRALIFPQANSKSVSDEKVLIK